MASTSTCNDSATKLKTHETLKLELLFLRQHKSSHRLLSSSMSPFKPEVTWCCALVLQVNVGNVGLHPVLSYTPSSTCLLSFHSHVVLSSYNVVVVDQGHVGTVKQAAAMFHAREISRDVLRVRPHLRGFY